jgi:hypothetical protein
MNSRRRMGFIPLAENHLASLIQSPNSQKNALILVKRCQGNQREIHCCREDDDLAKAILHMEEAQDSEAAGDQQEQRRSSLRIVGLYDERREFSLQGINAWLQHLGNAGNGQYLVA